jgi:hypothetical protein
MNQGPTEPFPITEQNNNRTRKPPITLASRGAPSPPFQRSPQSRATRPLTARVQATHTALATPAAAVAAAARTRADSRNDNGDPAGEDLDAPRPVAVAGAVAAGAAAAAVVARLRDRVVFWVGGGVVHSGVLRVRVRE